MKRTIGIAGGMGPYAGIDLYRKICDQTEASEDQQHLDIALLSYPADVPDRTEFVLGHEPVNPAEGIFRLLVELERIGAVVAGIPCNTAHAPEILDPVLNRMSSSGHALKVVHMVDEVARQLERIEGIRKVGVLATTGTVRAGIYDAPLSKHGFEVVYPSDTVQSEVHAAIYSPVYGIKASGRATERAISDIQVALTSLLDAGADAVVLACTELPLAVTATEFLGRAIVDATLVLAKLIREVAPERLRVGAGMLP